LVDDPSDEAVCWRISGRVQGVGFRYFVLLAARREGLRGAVRNLPDGSVEIRAVGPAAELARLREAARRGPGGARVEAVEELEALDAESFPSRGFEIRP